jgi:hypothetical protein
MYKSYEKYKSEKNIEAIAEVALGGRRGVQNIPRSACVKTNGASRRVPTDVTLARFAGSVGFYPRAARYILYPLYPPGAHL